MQNLELSKALQSLTNCEDELMLLKEDWRQTVMIKDRLFTWGLISLSGIVLVIVLVCGWFEFVDGTIYDPVLEWGTRFGRQYQTTKDVYCAGDMVYARLVIHKNRSIPGILKWNLVDHRLINYPPREVTLPAGVWDTVVEIQQIPWDADSGEHWFSGEVSYQANFMRIVTYPIWSNKFTVVAKPCEP